MPLAAHAPLVNIALQDDEPVHEDALAGLGTRSAGLRKARGHGGAGGRPGFLLCLKRLLVSRRKLPAQAAQETPVLSGHVGIVAGDLLQAHPVEGRNAGRSLRPFAGGAFRFRRVLAKCRLRLLRPGRSRSERPAGSPAEPVAGDKLLRPFARNLDAGFSAAPALARQFGNGGRRALEPGALLLEEWLELLWRKLRPEPLPQGVELVRCLAVPGAAHPVVEVVQVGGAGLEPAGGAAKAPFAQIAMEHDDAVEQALEAGVPV